MQQFNEYQVEMLIDLVREKPALYDKSDNKYKKVDWRDKTWEEIARTINADKKDCKTAWRSLRDQFMKCAKDSNESTDQDANNTKKKYKYFENLLFLQSFVRPRLHSGHFKMQETAEVDDDDWSNDIFLGNECSVSDPLLPTLDSTNSTVLHDDHGEVSCKSPKIEVLVSELSQSSACKFDCLLKPSPAKKRKEEDSTETFKEFLSTLLFDVSAQRKPTEFDSVDKFFLSVAETVKTYNLSVSEKALLQCKILIFTTEELEKLRN